MNKTISILILLLTFSINLFSFDKVERSVFTMNLQCFKNNWEFRLEEIIKKVAKISPDVISFQEVCEGKSDSSIKAIEEKLKAYGYEVKTFEKFYTHKAWDTYDEYLVIISKHKSKNNKSGFLPYSPLMRGYVSIEINNIRYINLHLEHKKEYYIYREQQINFLINKFSSENHIMMGDFNSGIHSQEQSSLYLNGYKSFFPSGTHPLPSLEVAIDGFWVSKNLSKSILSYGLKALLYRKISGSYLSDHAGVLLDIY